MAAMPVVTADTWPEAARRFLLGMASAHIIAARWEMCLHRYSMQRTWTHVTAHFYMHAGIPAVVIHACHMHAHVMPHRYACMCVRVCVCVVCVCLCVW